VALNASTHTQRLLFEPARFARLTRADIAEAIVSHFSTW
jgi:hypothetical protein